MRNIIVENKTTSLKSELTAGYCDSFLCRFKGLMFRSGIPDNWGLLLVQPGESIVNSAIHMFAVPFNLGVVWINQAGLVVDVAEVKKWVGIKSPKQPARYVLEVTPFRLKEFNLGDKIAFIDHES